MKIRLLILFAALAMFFVGSCINESDITFKRYYTAGAVIYQTRCQNCHGSNGEGLSALIPPLTDTAYLKNNLHTLSCIIRYGAERPLPIAGKVYQSKMPPGGLSPIEIARVLTYIGNSFGNKLKTIPIEVTDADLKNCR
jgi:mono/diheme cytochrome c family protein